METTSSLLHPHAGERARGEDPLLEFLERVALGNEVVIAKAGRPVARLVPVVPEVRERHPGNARGDILAAPDFDSPLPEDVRSGSE